MEVEAGELGFARDRRRAAGSSLDEADALLTYPRYGEVLGCLRELIVP